MTDTPTGEKVKRLLDRLKKEYGAPGWHPEGDPISVLVQTILSQNTSDTNSRSAFRSLQASFDNWEDVAAADINTIMHCIRGGGLGKIKAQRIKQALKEIELKRGRLELDLLKRFTPSEAQHWLEQLPGVGAKTACCVLLFALGMAALPVDTHILRVTKRLGLIRSKSSLDAAHRTLGTIVPPGDMYQFHILIITHGRRTCRARNPRCPDCVLTDTCLSYPVFNIDKASNV